DQMAPAGCRGPAAAARRGVQRVQPRELRQSRRLLRLADLRAHRLGATATTDPARRQGGVLTTPAAAVPGPSTGLTTSSPPVPRRPSPRREGGRRERGGKQSPAFPRLRESPPRPLTGL